jgi:beta-phosphoglucomutase-like phosphatase (HAD superfamily)
MAEDAGEQLAGTDRSNPSAAPKPIAQLKAEIAETRNRIAATIDRTTERLPSVFRTGPESGRSVRAAFSVGTIAGNAFSMLRRAGHGFAIRKSPRFAIGSGLVAVAGLTLLLTSRRRRQHEPRLRLQRVPEIDDVSALLFDVDGTLIDSNAAHAQAWAQALSEHGFPCEASRVRPFVGMGGDKLLPAVAGIAEDSPQGKAINTRKKALFSELLPRLAPTRGGRLLVSYLRKSKKRVIVATSADDREMHALLDRAGVADLIPRRTSKDDAAQSKPDPDIVAAALSRAGSRRAKAVMIGDTPYDIEAARRAGIRSIALRCGGYWSDAELAGAVAIFDDPAALLAYWRR